MRKSTYKDAAELVSHLLLDTETTLKSGVPPVRLCWRKLSFHLQEAILRDVDLYPFLPRSLGPYVVQTHAGPVYAASVSEFICAPALLYLEDLDSLVSSIPSESYSLSSSEFLEL